MHFECQFEVFWVVTSCNVLIGYQRFRGPRCIRLHTSSEPAYIQNKIIFNIFFDMNINFAVGLDYDL
jgi:hypothetical protein